MCIKIYYYLVSYFFLFLVLFNGTVSAYEIHRMNDATLIRFFPAELNMDSSGFIEEDIVKRACVIKTPAIKLSGSHMLSAKLAIKAVDYRNFVKGSINLSKQEVLRLNLEIEKHTGDRQNLNHTLRAVDIGQVDLIAETSKGIEVSFTSNEPLELLTKAASVSGEYQVRVDVCDIAAFTFLTIQYLDLTVSNSIETPSTVFNFPVTGPLNCFNTGLFLNNCRLDETTLSAKNNVDLEYEVDFSFDCRGHDVDFAFQTDEAVKLLKPAKGKQKLKITGTELKLIDLNSEKTSRATFDLGCSLHVDRVHKRLSTRAKRTFQNYLVDVKLLTQVLSDMHKVDSLTKDLTISILKSNPQQLIWTAKSIKNSIESMALRSDNAAEKKELEKSVSYLNRLTSDEKLNLQADLQKEIEETQTVLKKLFDKRIKAIFNRLDDIQLSVAEMWALLDADERRAEEDLEEKIDEAKKTFN